MAECAAKVVGKSGAHTVSVKGNDGGGDLLEPAEGPDSGSVAKADLARELNRQIAQMGRALTPSGEVNELAFYCECGCMKSLLLTVEAFDAAGGDLIEGHSREWGLR